MVESGDTLDTPSLRRLASTVKGLLGKPLLSDADPVEVFGKRGGGGEIKDANISMYAYEQQ